MRGHGVTLNHRTRLENKAKQSKAQRRIATRTTTRDSPLPPQKKGIGVCDSSFCVGRRKERATSFGMAFGGAVLRLIIRGRGWV